MPGRGSVGAGRQGGAGGAGAGDGSAAVTDSRFHFLGAVCNLAAGQYRRVIELSERAAAERSLEVESRFVMAWAHLHLGEMDAARDSLRKVAAEVKSPSAGHARLLLGQLSFERGAHDEAMAGGRASRLPPVCAGVSTIRYGKPYFWPG